MAATAWNGTSTVALAVRTLGASASVMLSFSTITAHQLARRDPRSQRAQVAFERAVFIDERRRGRHAFHERVQRRGDGCRIVETLTQTCSLYGCERMCRGDLLGQLQNTQAIACADRAHAHLVLVMRFGRTRKYAGGNGQLERFRRLRRRRYLPGLEAMIDGWALGRRARQT